MSARVQSTEYEYGYDAYGQRIVQLASDGDILNEYNRDGKPVWMANRREGGIAHTYLYLGNQLVATQIYDAATNPVLYQTTDTLGSVIAQTNQDAWVDHFNYYQAWGGLQSGSLDDGPGYANQINDTNTGLSYAQQRYYDPSVGRFMSMDPVDANTVTGGNFNRYIYANDNPYRYTDPDGRTTNSELPEDRRKDWQRNNAGRLRAEALTGTHIRGVSAGGNVRTIQIAGASATAMGSAAASRTTVNNSSGQPILDANTGQPLSKPPYANLRTDIQFGESVRNENQISKAEIMRLWFRSGGTMDYQRGGSAPFNPQWRDYTNFTFGAVSAAAGYSAFSSLYVGGAGYNVFEGKIRAGFLGTPDSNWKMWEQGRQYYIDSGRGAGGE